MEKLKNGWATSKRVVAPMSLEKCIELVQGFDNKYLELCGVVSVGTQNIDADNAVFTLRTSEAEMVGYFKRWEENTTLLVLKLRARPGFVFWRNVWRVFKWVTLGVLFIALFALIFRFLDSIDGSVDGNISSNVSGVYLGSWNGSMTPTQIAQIPGHEGVLLRLMQDRFGNDEFEQGEDAILDEDRQIHQSSKTYGNSK
jgi:hypothetical protein